MLFDLFLVLGKMISISLLSAYGNSLSLFYIESFRLQYMVIRYSADTLVRDLVLNITS